MFQSNFSTDVSINTVDMTPSNDKQDLTHGLNKTTIKLPSLNKNSINVFSGCEGKKLKSANSINHLLNEDLLQINQNNKNSFSQTGTNFKLFNSVTPSLNNTSANSSHISSNGSVKSNKIEARSLSVGHRKVHSTLIKNNNNNDLSRNLLNTTPLATKQPHEKNLVKNKKNLLVRRHSTYQDNKNKINTEFADLVFNSNKKNGNFFL